MADNVLIDPSKFPVIHAPTASVTGEDTRGWGSDLLSGTEEIRLFTVEGVAGVRGTGR